MLNIINKLTRAAGFVFLSSLIFWACGSENKSQAESLDALSEVKNKLPDIKKGEFAGKDKTYPILNINGLDWLGRNLDYEISESWCYDSKTANCEQNGRLYRWAGAKEACAALGPDWRLPSDEEWRRLVNSFGGYFSWLQEKEYGDPVKANRALAENGSSGFQLPLSGWRGSNGGFDSAGKTGFFWTATEANEDEAWFYILLPEGGKLTRRSTNKRMGMACRCVRGAM